MGAGGGQMSGGLKTGTGGRATHTFSGVSELFFFGARRDCREIGEGGVGRAELMGTDNARE
jgi:hypothetical protein